MAFPWHLGVFDAHCHPTDSLSTLSQVKTMRAQVLTVMATRAQDQELVAQAATEYGVPDKDLNDTTKRKIIPAFGWHPWFSHQMFDEELYGTKLLTEEQKISHYQSVLTPDPMMLHSSETSHHHGP